MLDKLFEYFKNIKGSPKTTILGAILMVLSGSTYLYQFIEDESSITTTSIEVVIGTVGLLFFFKSDHEE